MNFMQRALQLAEQGRYTCMPNPMVGCVIVNNGEIIAEGYHAKTGAAHAEIHALQQAGELAKDATAYVTLEPCCHQGRTGPCTEALIQAGIAEVHVACLDPNPRVAGQGVQRLEQAGIKVIVGELEQATKKLNQFFFHFIQHNLPFVIVKWAMSLDGKIATHTGDSKWITSDAARQYAHQVRQQVGAIIVGSGTVLADDPQLTVRLPVVQRQPLRVVFDSRGRCKPTAKIFSAELPGKTLLVTSEQADDTWCQTFADQQIEVLKLPTVKQKIDLKKLLTILAEREINSVLVEGGSELNASFIAQDLVQQIQAYIAPKTIGGMKAPGALAGIGIDTMAAAQQWQFSEVKTLADDVLLIAEQKNV